MAVYTLESLVLRGVSVLCDGKAVGLCLGASEAAVQLPEVRIFMRHPSLGYPQANPNSRAGRQVHDAKRDVDDAAFGAGRSRGRAGVLSRRSPALPAGRTTPSGWSTPERLSAKQLNPSIKTAWRRASSGEWSTEKSQAATTRSPFTVATSVPAATVLASTRGTGAIVAAAN
jgi:hypothetical protein